ncbi:MAG: hypothetical protein KAG26_08890 [Methylococcales bacterium]|nr:hypothetical protein [Methylococcales bacterium]
MKYLSTLLVTLFLAILFLPSFGQSKKKMESYLKNSWISAAISYETGDTIQDTNQRLVLGKKGKMEAKFDGNEHTGTWKYNEGSNSLDLGILISDQINPISMEIATSADQILTVISRNGGRFRAIIFVEEGSGIEFKTVKVPEKSFAEIQAESDASRNADLGYTPTGTVIERIDYNLELEVEADGNAGRSKGDGIVYLLESEGAQKLVIIRGQDAMPEEWTVLEKTNEFGQTYYQCNLQYDYKRGEKIEVNIKAKVQIAAPNVIMSFEDGKTIKFTVI